MIVKRLSFILMLLAGTSGFFACQSTPPDTCPPRPEDDTGHLEAICEYILENSIDVSPGKPQSYNIVRIEEGKLGERDIIVVYLDCCYIGDIARIDKQTGEVLSFQLGPQ